MITPLPETVRSILGEGATRDLALWLEDAMSEGTIPREEWHEHRTRLTNVERDIVALKVDVAGLTAAVTALQTQVADLRADIRALRSDMDTRFDRMIELFNDRFDRQEARMAQQTRWAIGTLGLVSTAVTVLLAIQTLAPSG